MVARTGDRYVTFETWCTHAECPLGDGWLEGGRSAARVTARSSRSSTAQCSKGPAVDPIVVAAASVTAAGRVVADISTLHA